MAWTRAKKTFCVKIRIFLFPMLASVEQRLTSHNPRSKLEDKPTIPVGTFGLHTTNFHYHTSKCKLNTPETDTAYGELHHQPDVFTTIG